MRSETPLALLFCGSGALACAAGLWLDDWFVLAGAFGAATAGAWWWTEPGRRGPPPGQGVTPEPRVPGSDPGERSAGGARRSP